MKKKRKPPTETVGFLVQDVCEDCWNIPTRLVIEDKTPLTGVLECTGEGDPPTLFLSRADAKAAIRRTKHWEAAFGVEYLGPKQVIVKVERLLPAPGGEA